LGDYYECPFLVSTVRLRLAPPDPVPRCGLSSLAAEKVAKRDKSDPAACSKLLSINKSHWLISSPFVLIRLARIA